MEPGHNDHLPLYTFKAVLTQSSMDSGTFNCCKLYGSSAEQTYSPNTSHKCSVRLKLVSRATLVLCSWNHYHIVVTRCVVRCLHYCRRLWSWRNLPGLQWGWYVTKYLSHEIHQPRSSFNVCMPLLSRHWLIWILWQAQYAISTDVLCVVTPAFLHVD